MKVAQPSIYYAYFYNMLRVLPFLFCFPMLIFSQRTETALDFSPNNSRLVFELNNDMLFSTDRYYTAGLGFSYSNKKFKKTLAQIILKPKSNEVVNFSGFGLEQKIFTPSSIVNSQAVDNDQPYSAYILLTNYAVNVNPVLHLKVSNEVGIGIMGPQAYGEEMQTFVHKVVNSAAPIGWEDQLQNTLLIDYRFRVEKGFGPDWLINHLVPFAGLRTGTLTTRVQMGAMIKLGNMHKLLNNSTDLELAKKKLIWEWTFSANFQGVLYDAKLQGSLFRDDPNALSRSEIISHQHLFRAGVNIFYQNFSLRYMINFSSSNFNESIYHRYGTMNIGYSF